MPHPMFDRIDRRREALQREIDAARGGPKPQAPQRRHQQPGILTQQPERQPIKPQE